MRILHALAVLALSLATVTVSVAPADAASTPTRITRCGQTISRDAYLAQNLTCTTGLKLVSPDPDGDNALTATIDLHGHRLTGPGPSADPGSVGISLPYGLAQTSSLTVRNGRLTQWGTALSIGIYDYGGSLEGDHLRLDHNDTGLYCNEGSCLLHDSEISSNTLGTGMEEGSVTLADDLFSNNVTGSESMFYGGTHVSSTAYRNNTVGIRAYGSLTVTGSAFSGNHSGILADTGYVFGVDHSRFTNNVDGLYLPFDPDAVEGPQVGTNNAWDNRRYGIYAPGAIDLGGNRAQANGEPCVGVVCAST